MVPIRNIKTKACPVCGCAIIVSESVEVDTYCQQVRLHCNGGQWEARRFACGYETRFIPNFYKESKGACCRNDPEILERKRKTEELKAQIMEVIESSSAPECVKENFRNSVKNKSWI